MYKTTHIKCTSNYAKYIYGVVIYILNMEISPFVQRLYSIHIFVFLLQKEIRNDDNCQQIKYTVKHQNLEQKRSVKFAKNPKISWSGTMFVRNLCLPGVCRSESLSSVHRKCIQSYIFSHYFSMIQRYSICCSELNLKTNSNTNNENGGNA